MSGRWTVAAASGLCAVAGVIWLLMSAGADKEATQGIVAQDASVSHAQTGDPASPFAPSNEVATSAAGSVLDADSVDRVSANSFGQADKSSASNTHTPLDIAQLARTALSDQEFDEMVTQLRSNPVLLQRLIDEFRQEQDPDRREQLMKLLGHAGGSDVTLLASELVYSGDDASRKLGLQMLQRAQPGSAEVQQIASDLLATEMEPQILVGTLTTLARPGTVNTENRTLLADQVALMTSHPDAGVRGVSLDILSRLSTDGRDTPVLLAALDDSSERVRESAAYALVDHEEDSIAVRSSLWQMLRNADQGVSPRSAAVMALRSLSLSAEEKDELDAIEHQLNQIRRLQ